MTTLSVSSNAAVVQVSGVLDCAALQPCRAALTRALQVRSAVVLDIQGVQVQEPLTVALLGAARRYVRARGAVLVLAGVSPGLFATLERAGVQHLYDMVTIDRSGTSADRDRGYPGEQVMAWPPSSPAIGTKVDVESRDGPWGPDGTDEMVMRMLRADDLAVPPLQLSLERLHVVLETQPLGETLAQIADLAASAIPGADGVGLTMVGVSGPDTRVASAPIAHDADEVQYRLGEGPGLEAVHIRRPLVCGSLGGERRWPRFGPRVGRMGIHSVLALPLIAADEVVGALNVYGQHRNSFTAEAVRIGKRFAVPASATVANARLVDRSSRAAQQLEQALVSRAVIDQAIGILMSRSGVTAEAAFDRLQAISQGEDTKLSEVATTIVDQAVNRARARRQGP